MKMTEFPDLLAQQALEVLEALAELVAGGQQLTIAPDWGFGSATFIAPDGSHTHVGGDWDETRAENLANFVRGMHQALVQGCGLSWVPVAPTTTTMARSASQLQCHPDHVAISGITWQRHPTSQDARWCVYSRGGLCIAVIQPQPDADGYWQGIVLYPRIIIDYCPSREQAMKVTGFELQKHWPDCDKL